jgi:hypothetical protein
VAHNRPINIIGEDSHMNTSLWLGAAIGALAAAIVNGIFNWILKRQELRVQRLGIALKCAELKHQQIVVSQDWAIRTEGQPRNVEHWDPLVIVIDYMKGMDEFDKSGDWAKGRRGHSK